MNQRIITPVDNYKELDQWIGKHRVFLVCDNSLKFLSAIWEHMEVLKKKGIQIILFNDIQPNPLYESVVRGINLFLEKECDAIMAIGGGSVIDVAKCIKLFSTADHSKHYLQQKIVSNSIPFLAMPTTAGTGSEATQYAVVYSDGEKQTVTDTSCVPETVLMDCRVLRTLPLYQKKSTMLDAFCHAIESFWSVNSTEKSRQMSRNAIHLIIQHMEGYLMNSDEGNAGMLLAANMAGKAINIAQTTAGHAMCYKITSLFGCAHGHAAALCVRKLYPWMIAHTNLCIDPRGELYLKTILDEIGQTMGCSNAQEASRKFEDLFISLEMTVPAATEEHFLILKSSVNPIRMKNHPALLEDSTINSLYHEILR